jgi:hypothetical protein
MPEWAKDVLGYGPLSAFACAVCYAVWKMAWYIIHQVVGNKKEGTRGYVGEWVDGEQTWRIMLTERLAVQSLQCATHVTSITSMNKLIESQAAIGIIARDQATSAAVQATSAAVQATDGNLSLEHIDKTLTERTAMLTRTSQGVQQLKDIELQRCELYRELLCKEFPNSASAVSRYCDAIKAVIEEETA